MSLSLPGMAGFWARCAFVPLILDSVQAVIHSTPCNFSAEDSGNAGPHGSAGISCLRMQVSQAECLIRFLAGCDRHSRLAWAVSRNEGRCFRLSRSEEHTSELQSRQYLV